MQQILVDLGDKVYEAHYCNAMLLQVPALHSLFAASHLLQDCARALEATDFLGLRQNVNFNKKASIRRQDSARRQFQAGLRSDVGL